jgi:hypothetical protein
VSETYEIKCGSRRLTLRDASTPQHAVVDYLRSLGCRDADFVRLAPDGVARRAPCTRPCASRRPLRWETGDRRRREGGGDSMSWLVVLLIVLLILALFGGVGYYRR